MNSKDIAHFVSRLTSAQPEFIRREISLMEVEGCLSSDVLVRAYNTCFARGDYRSARVLRQTINKKYYARIEQAIPNPEKP